MFALFVGGVGLGGLLIDIVIFAACVGLVYVALDYFKVKIPSWVSQVFWIVVVAVVIVAAIRFLMSI